MEATVEVDRTAGPAVWRTTLTSSAALSTAVLPVFLLGALSGAIRRDLGVDEAAIGAAVTVVFVAASLAAGPAGRLTERVGSTPALRAGVVVSGLATAAVGVLARSWWHLLVPLVVAGGAVALIDTGAARAFARRVPLAAQGSAFGVKEASVPTASLIAGLALPTVAGTLGWRGVFVSVLGVAALVWLVLPGDDRGGSEGPPRDAPLDPTGPAVYGRSLVRFAVGAGLGAAAATAAATFLVPAGTARGLAEPTAGLLLAGASVASIVVRLVAGRWADDARRVPALAVAVLLAAGAAGATLLAAFEGFPATVLGAVLLLGGGWGWTGLAFLTAVRERPGAPGAAAGVVLTGIAAGGALGPLAFGALAARVSYTAAWTLTAVALLTAAAVTATARGTVSSREAAEDEGTLH